MSQEKVDQHKKDKANRKEILKKQKRKVLFAKLGSSLVAVIVIAWIGFAAYDSMTNPAGQTLEVNLSSIDQYMTALSKESAE